MSRIVSVTKLNTAYRARVLGNFLGNRVLGNKICANPSRIKNPWSRISLFGPLQVANLSVENSEPKEDKLYTACSNNNLLEIMEALRDIGKEYIDASFAAGHKLVERHYIQDAKDLEGFQYHEPEYRAIFKEIYGLFGRQKDFEVLDIGCGTGSFIYILKKLGIKEVKGIDVSEQCVEFTQNNSIERLDIVEGNIADDIPKEFKDQKFDLTIGSALLDSETLLDIIVIPEKRLRILRNIANLTKPGGYSIHVADKIPFSNEELEKCGFEIIRRVRLKVHTEPEIIVLKRKEEPDRAKFMEKVNRDCLIKSDGKDPNPSKEVEDLIQKLKDRHPRAIEDLIHLNPSPRMEVLIGLGREDLSALTNFLNHKYPMLRRYAAEALGEIGAKEAKSALSQRQKVEEVNFVQDTISEALAKISP